MVAIMGSFFNMDNGFFSFLGKAFDAVILSTLYLVCCIPIITIGTATTALYYATVKGIRRERGYVYREFFKSFRLNFKTGAIAGILLTVVFAVLIFDILFARSYVKDNTGEICPVDEGQPVDVHQAFSVYAGDGDHYGGGHYRGKLHAASYFYPSRSDYFAEFLPDGACAEKIHAKIRRSRRRDRQG